MITDDVFCQLVFFSGQVGQVYITPLLSISADLDKSLSELGLFERQALVVVPRTRATVYQRGPFYSESNSNTDPNSGGYVAYVRRVLSYANPFSYFGGGTANASSSGPERQTSTWEYGELIKSFIMQKK